MRKIITKLLFGIFTAFLTTGYLHVEASESFPDWTPIISKEAAFTDSVIQETESSVVMDMYMKPASKLPVEKVVYDNPLNPYKTTKVPAQITKQGRFYFIVDTFHDQVIYHNKLEDPVSKWRVVSSNLSGPHSIASDGKYYLIADTENDRVLIFEWNQGGFRLTQQFEGLGVRPHYIQYDETADCFYVWSSMTCEMYVLAKNSEDILCIKEILKLKHMSGHYIRSFTISGDYILFPSGTNQQILLTDRKTLQILERFPVPGEVSGMAYIKKIGNYYYMTISTDDKFDQNKATIIRTKDLRDLVHGKYENIASYFPRIQVPYYIDYMQGYYYMTNHGNSISVFRFQVQNDELKYIKAIEY